MNNLIITILFIPYILHLINVTIKPFYSQNKNLNKSKTTPTNFDIGTTVLATRYINIFIKIIH